MARLPITCDTLGTLDGGAARAIIDAAIRDAVADLEDRAHQDDKPRKVAIQLTFEMREDNNVEVTVEAIPKVPMRRTARTIAKVRHQDGRPGLVFSQHAPDDPEQSTIDEYDATKRD